MSAAKLLFARRGHVAATAAAVAICSLLPHPNRHVYSDSPTSRLSQDASLISHAQRVQTKSLHADSSEHSIKRGDADVVSKATDPDIYTPAFEDDGQGSWAAFSRNVDNVIEGVSRFQWGGLGDQIVDYVLPTWARHIPEAIQKLKFELSMEPGTMADEVWQEAQDPNINPEIMWDAKVRIGDSLCEEELRFRERRKKQITKAFAKYLGLNEKDVDPDDIPTIAMCGSGGGLRALIAGTSSYMSAQHAGLFDCVTYTAGVSGSCWLQTLFYSTLGNQNLETVLKHVKSRVGTHIAFPPDALKLATSAPTNKFILSGFIEKLKGDPNASFGLVDIYSLLLSLRLLVPHGDLDVHSEDLKLSNQRRYIENGQNPMPIYTAVRHEIPIEEEEKNEALGGQALKDKIEEKAKKEAWFQWIEMHPFEVGCEEFNAWIPTWSLGRPFNEGKNQIMDTGAALPEYRLSLLLGIWGSAFTATLSHYYKEIRPVLTGITGFAGLSEMLEEKNQDLIKIHPIDPATVPNWAYGMKDQLPSSCPESVFKNDHLQLMDAGMSNNLPIYPLLRQGRDVDVLIAFDASADIKKENWLSVVDGYAKQRGIKTWPVGTGWPKRSAKPQESVEALDEAQAGSSQEASAKLEAVKEGEAEKDQAIKAARMQSGTPTENELGSCNIWVGSKEERASEEEPPPSKRLAWNDPDDSTFDLMKPDAGITVIYFPLLPNEKVPGVDPDTTDFLSTWNFIYTPEQVDKVAELAKTNFEEGADATKRTIRAVYERKKQLREQSETKGRINLFRRKLRDHADAFAGS